MRINIPQCHRIVIVLFLFILPSFTSCFVTFVSKTNNGLNERTTAKKNKHYWKFSMVRNIDLPEAIVFYGDESIFFLDDNDPNNVNKPTTKPSTLLPGVEYLADECKRDNIAMVAILSQSGNNNEQYLELLPNQCHVFKSTQPPPNPRDLWEAIHSITVEPKGFGGSSGFGTKAADPERCPLPKHVVVLCHTEDQCRAARYCGMRVLCLQDNDLADGIVFGWDEICVDDLSTPGSFWLNPPNPRDDDGSKVDPEQLIRLYQEEEQQQQQQDLIKDKNDASAGDNQEANNLQMEESDEEMSDEELRAILADMDSL